jgi:hypothetical protein
MKTGPPLPPQYIIPSEYGVGQFVPPADTRRDPTPQDIAARAEANRISYEEVERQLGPEGFAWMFEKGLLLRLRRRRSALSRFRILAVVATLISATVT